MEHVGRRPDLDVASIKNEPPLLVSSYCSIVTTTVELGWILSANNRINGVFEKLSVWACSMNILFDIKTPSHTYLLFTLSQTASVV
jgi:hypothetical protein